MGSRPGLRDLWAPAPCLCPGGTGLKGRAGGRGAGWGQPGRVSTAAVARGDWWEDPASLSPGSVGDTGLLGARGPWLPAAPVSAGDHGTPSPVFLCLRSKRPGPGPGVHADPPRRAPASSHLILGDSGRDRQAQGTWLETLGGSAMLRADLVRPSWPAVQAALRVSLSPGPGPGGPRLAAPSSDAGPAGPSSEGSAPARGLPTESSALRSAQASPCGSPAAARPVASRRRSLLSSRPRRPPGSCSRSPPPPPPLAPLPAVLTPAGSSSLGPPGSPAPQSPAGGCSQPTLSGACSPLPCGIRGVWTSPFPLLGAV